MIHYCDNQKLQAVGLSFSPVPEHNRLVSVEGCCTELHNALHQLPTCSCPPAVCADMYTGVSSVLACLVAHADISINSLQYDRRIRQMFSKFKTRQASLSLSVKHEEIPPLHGNIPRLGIDMDIVCELVTRRIAGKQTAESSPDKTWKREGPGTDAVCVGRQYVFIPLHTHCICFLISHRHMRGFPASSVPLKSSRHVCLCQAVACFRDYIFSPEFPFSFASKEFSINSHPPFDKHTHTHTRTHTHILTFTFVLWRGLWEVIRKFSCITMNVVWDQKTACNMIKHIEIIY